MTTIWSSSQLKRRLFRPFCHTIIAHASFSVPKKRGRHAVVDESEDVENHPPRKAAEKRTTAGRQKKTTAPCEVDDLAVTITGTGNPATMEGKLRRLGVKVVHSWDECTHLVADKIRRTTKFLCALSSGKRIVSTEWVEASAKAKTILGVFFMD